MVEFLNETVLWWHWIVLGIILFIFEMTVSTFVMLMLAIAALFVGLIAFVLAISFNTELFVWIVLSVLSISIWMKWFRRSEATDSGQSNYRLDTLGIVTEDIKPHDRGKVDFDTPVLGNTSWHATADMDISKGSRVKIIEVNGQLIKVESI